MLTEGVSLAMVLVVLSPSGTTKYVVAHMPTGRTGCIVAFSPTSTVGYLNGYGHVRALYLESTNLEVCIDRWCCKCL